MSQENNLSKPPAKDDNQSSGSRKTATTTRPPEQGLKCPRCDSPNTKFCYYNNYSLTQPRHFCKTCRRYWTKGGALRNVPIGGGCRKNKKVKTSRLSGDSNDSGSSSELGGFKFFHGLSPPVDFQLRGLTFPRLHHPPLATGFHNQFSFGEVSATADASGSSNSMTGFNYPFSSTGSGLDGAIHGVSSMNVHSSLASSIESLSSINQDLHWKLQQQRLAALFGGDNENDNGGVSPVNLENQTHKPQPILFQNLEISKPGISADGDSRREGTSGDAATEWFFGNSFASVAATTTAIHENGNGSNWNGVHAWGDHVQQQYSALP